MLTAQQAAIPLPLQPHITCARCGATLTGRLRRATPAGPVCPVDCAPKTHQQSLFA